MSAIFLTPCIIQLRIIFAQVGGGRNSSFRFPGRSLGGANYQRTDPVSPVPHYRRPPMLFIYCGAILFLNLSIYITFFS
jgi:hypothetical protein